MNENKSQSKIDNMAKKTVCGNYQIAPADWNTLLNLAKEGKQSRKTIKKLNEKSAMKDREIARLKKQIAKHEEKPSVIDTMKYLQAKQLDPKALQAAVERILHKSTNAAKMAKGKVSEAARAVDDVVLPGRERSL